MLGVVGLQHHVTSPREFVPTTEGFRIHRTEFPLPHRILDAGLETPLLLLLADFEPKLDHDDATVDDVLLDLRTQFEKALVLFGRTKAHDVFHAGTVVPAAIEDHDLAARREL